MFRIVAYDHIGVRVTDIQKALNFYALLGFHPEPGETFEEHDAVGLINDTGLRVNLIHNAIARDSRRNILMDEPDKWPGLTHLAFVVDNLQQLMNLMTENSIAITDGPMKIGTRRIICFVRDPDGNVIEFDELLSDDAEDIHP